MSMSYLPPAAMSRSPSEPRSFVTLAKVSRDSVSKSVSSALGFILVGIIVGPFGLASLVPYLPWLSAITISAPSSIAPIAQLGVVLLLFMIGLELSFERLWVMRRLVFGLGLLQIVLCTAVLAGAAILLGHGRVSAVVIGLALAMSSTAVVLQVLSEEKRLTTATGRQLCHPAPPGSRGGAGAFRPWYV